MGTRIAHSSWAQDAWKDLLENEAKDPQWVQSEEYDYHIEYELIVALREIASGYDTYELEKELEIARLLKAINDDNSRAWEVVAIPFDGHDTLSQIELYNEGQPIDRLVANVNWIAEECKAIEQSNEDERQTSCKVVDRAQRLLDWLEPVAEDYYGLPRIKAIAKLIRAESGLMTKEDRDEPGAWRDDPIGRTALGLTK